MESVTSVVVKALISLAALSTIAAFCMTIINDRRQRDLLQWVQAARPAVWRAMPRTVYLLPDAAAAAYFRRQLASDIDFVIRDTAARRGQPAMLAALAMGIAAIALEVQERVQNYLDIYQTGILVSKVNIDESAPPDGYLRQVLAPFVGRSDD